jgi:hypothetical protein
MEGAGKPVTRVVASATAGAPVLRWSSSADLPAAGLSLPD